MTDDLVKRLRETTHMYQVDCELKMKCAARIEELEAENNLLKTSGIIEVAVRNPRVMEYIQHWEGRAEAAEAKLAKAEVIIRIIASDKWDERLGEAVDLSCEYLAELKGDSDD